MVKRQPFSQAPDALKELITDLVENGDYLVYENERQEPVVFISPLPDEAEARRMKTTARLRQILAQTPEIPQSEEEVVRDVNDALVAIREEARQGAVS